jgi:hypothetical protein
MKDKIWIVAAFVLTFAAGVLVGALVVRHFGPPSFAMAPLGRTVGGYFPRHEGRSPIPSVEMLQRRLGLDETQQQQVAGIVEKYRGQFQEHFRQIHPTVQGLIAQMRGEIETVLRPEQLEKFRREFPRREHRAFAPHSAPHPAPEEPVQEPPE